MRFIIPPRISVFWAPTSLRAQRSGALIAHAVLAAGMICGHSPASASAQSASPQTTQRPVQASSQVSKVHKAARTGKPAPAPEPPPPPPMPNWPVNESPSHASVTWDTHSLRIEASNSSLQQILKEVSLETGSRIEGMVPDQRVYGSYGPGQARDVISQLLQGSGCNVLLAGDLGSGAPRQIVLSPRRSGAASPRMAQASTQDNSPDDESTDNEVEEQPQPAPQQPIPMQPNPNSGRPGFGPNGPIRTPQQVMEEMQRQQLLQQQQQQGNQPGNPPQ